MYIHDTHTVMCIIIILLCTSYRCSDGLDRYRQQWFESDCPRVVCNHYSSCSYNIVCIIDYTHAYRCIYSHNVFFSLPDIFYHALLCLCCVNASFCFLLTLLHGYISQLLLYMFTLLIIANIQL